MKTGKKIAVLALIFVAAAIIYFVWPLGRKEENKTGVVYTAMGEAELPVVYPTALGRELAPLFGHREELAVTAERDSLLVLPEDRRLPIRIQYGDEIKTLQYEIRTMDMTHLVERTMVTDWTEENGQINAVLPVQNLLEPETQYQLGIQAVLSDGTSAWYYARILETDNDHAAQMLALAEDFSQKTFHYDSAQELTTYMESTPSADNSSFGTVTLKNSFTQMTWGSLGVSRGETVFASLKELSGDLANIELEYYVTREADGGAGETDGGETEVYGVTENFTLKWSSQRIYMMDYERTMNQLFSGSRELFSGKRILLGISDGEGMYAKKSENGRYTVFVTNRELWAYDREEGDSICIFAFGGWNTDDLRALQDRHGVEILEVSNGGAVDFLVYGYMNRGGREGYTGVSYYRYEAESNTLTEQFFLPAAEPYSELRLDLARLAHKGQNGIFYMYMGGSVYGIDLNSHEYVVVASGLDEERFAVSSDGSRLAWQEDTGIYDSRMLHIMDLDTGDKTQIGDGKSDAYRILGFVGSDCVYGIGEYGDHIISNGRTMGLYLKSLDIIDQNMASAMHYEKSGKYIRDVAVDESRIHLELVSDRDGGFFGEAEEETLVCNAKVLPGKMDDIGWYASDVKGRVYFVQLGQDISASQKIRTISPKKTVREENNEIHTEAPASGVEEKFYAYGRGRLIGIYSSFADAADAAYDPMGFVTFGKHDLVWERASRPGSYFIRDLNTASRKLDRYRTEFTGTSRREGDALLLDASGSSLNIALLFVCRNQPVLLYTGEGSFLYLTGYDQTHVRIWDPSAAQSMIIPMEEARARFESLGSDYICCLPL